MKKLNVDEVQGKIEAEGLDYYLDNYASNDVEGTSVDEAFQAYRVAKKKLIKAFEDAGVAPDFLE